MVRLNTDLVSLCKATIDGRLAEQQADWDPRAALGVVMAAGGYPASYEKGAIIDGLPRLASDTCKVFHAGTILSEDEVVTSGGRVLCVVGLGDSVASARDVAYAQVNDISWNKVYFRKDIGHRAIAREHS
jgi:phosphoribosylamine--glycine ligase